MISDSSGYTEYLRNTVKKVKVLPIKNNNGDAHNINEKIIPE